MSHRSNGFEALSAHIIPSPAFRVAGIEWMPVLPRRHPSVPPRPLHQLAPCWGRPCWSPRADHFDLRGRPAGLDARQLQRLPPFRGLNLSLSLDQYNLKTVPRLSQGSDGYRQDLPRLAARAAPTDLSKSRSAPKSSAENSGSESVAFFSAASQPQCDAFGSRSRHTLRTCGDVPRKLHSSQGR